MRPLRIIADDALAEAVARLGEATAAKKCWQCGCLHDSLDSVESAYPAEARPAELDAAIAGARARLLPIRYDCLGCDVCYPPLAMNSLNIDVEACPAETVEARDGWPPLPGSYTVLRYNAPVAVCTLNDEALVADIAALARDDTSVSVVGTCHTENLGLERIVSNVLGNPNIRFLILCGTDSQQAIGHLPGQSMVALAHAGTDDRGRIPGARGKRPVLRNLERAAVEHFRSTVEVIDLIGNGDPQAIMTAAAQAADRNPGPAQPFAGHRPITVIPGYLPERMVSDPSGYFVVYVDRGRRLLLLEHYANSGVLNAVIEGTTSAELYIPAIERGFLSRLDHAAYLGRELARAEDALRTGGIFVQDAAPERVFVSLSCGPAGNCSPGSGCNSNSNEPRELQA